MIINRSVLVELEGPGGALVVVLATLLVVLALGVAVILENCQHLPFISDSYRSVPQAF